MTKKIEAALKTIQRNDERLQRYRHFIEAIEYTDGDKNPYKDNSHLLIGGKSRNGHLDHLDIVEVVPVHQLKKNIEQAIAALETKQTELKSCMTLFERALPE